MRFDDTLDTVLAADLTTSFGMQSAWRQLVDLIGRRRVPPEARALAVLHRIRAHVPVGVRAASGRGLEFADPPPALVHLFARDEFVVAAPVLRSARLSSSDWVALLPDLEPASRSVLRARRDLSPAVKRALESYGTIDFVLGDETVPEAAIAAEAAADVSGALAAAAEAAPPLAEPEPAPVLAPAEAAPLAIDWTEIVGAHSEPVSVAAPAQRPAALPAALPAEAVVHWPEVLAAAPEPPAVSLPAPEPAPALAVTPEPVARAPHDLEPVEPAEAADPVDTLLSIAAADSAAGNAAAEASSDADAEAPPSLGDLLARLEGERLPELLWEPHRDAAPFAPPPAADAHEAPPFVAAPGVADDGVEPLVDRAEKIAAAEAAPQPATEAVAETASAPAEADPSEWAEDLSFIALVGGAPAFAAQAQSGTAAAQTPVDPPAVAAQTETMDSDFLLAEPPVAAAAEADGAPSHLPEETPAPADAEGPFRIADVVARIDAFWRRREEGVDPEPRAPRVAEAFRFETDAKGVVRWVDGVSRAPVIGLSLDLSGLPGGSRVDGIAAGAFRRRAGFSNARLQIEGESDAAGDWLISGIPVFDSSNGRFTGYRGTARRPRPDERAEIARPAPPTAADSLRQLVHELRTPTNAIAGFAEMIESQMLGPVPDPYRDRANVIRAQARELLGAIDDLDLAARIESDALALVPGRVVLRPVLVAIAEDLAPLADLRGAWIALPVDDLAVTGDRRAVERLLSRLLATLVSAAAPGERIGVRTALDHDAMVAIAIDRPGALADFPGEAMLGIDDESGDATLLGTGFALRLARNLAKELGGSLVIDVDSLTLRLPAAVNAVVEQAHLN